MCIYVQCVQKPTKSANRKQESDESKNATHNMVYLYDACDQISDFCHQQLLRKMRRKISWTDGRTDRRKTVYPLPLRENKLYIKEGFVPRNPWMYTSISRIFQQQYKLINLNLQPKIDVPPLIKIDVPPLIKKQMFLH